MTGQTVDDLKEKVSLDVRNERVDHILQQLLGSRGYTFQFNDNVIIIRKREPHSPVKKNQTDSSINTTTISGKVTDAAGTPLIGATIVVKGTNDGTVTDNEGNFTLPNVNKNATMLIRSVGYETREIAVKGQRIMVQLNVVVSDLDETVVIAYGTTTRRYSTGNVSTIKAKDIERQPVSNPLLALQGRVPGVIIEQSTGLPGSGVAVRIQGATSLRKNGDPLYVIDGVPYTSRTLYTLSLIQGTSGDNGQDFGNVPAGAGNPLSFINPADIESIDVLKDADATAIYGSRAANGAILITTKKGKTGKTQVNFDVQHGWGVVPKKLKLLNTSQYLDLRKEAYKNAGLTVPDATTPSDQSNADLTYYDQNRYTDWQEVLIGNTAEYTKANASVSGGNANTQFLMGVGYQKETTVFPGDLADRKGSLHFNVSHSSSNQRFKVTLSGNYMLDDNRLIGTDLTDIAITLAPNAPELYHSDGSLNWALLPNGDASWRNPLAYLQQRYKNKTNNLIFNNTISYQILPGLDVRNSFGYTNLRSDEILTAPLSMHPPQNRPYSQNQSTFSTGMISTWIAEPQLNYKKILKRASIDVLIGATFQQNTTSYSSITGMGYSSELLLEDITSAANLQTFNGASVYKYNAFFGRLHYSWDNRFLLTLSGRRDGSSRFGRENLFHNFGSIAGAWIFSEENFFKKQQVLSFGKLKASYGTTGNDGIGDYQFLNRYNAVSAVLPYQGITGLQPTELSNPYLQWEETRKLSLGIDLGFLNDRILFAANYFRNRSSNQLVSYGLPAVTGYTSIQQNLDAVIQNTGWELSFSTENIKAGRFRWNSNINLTIPRNKLVSYPGLETSSYKYDYTIGHSTNIRKRYKYLGVDPETGLYQIADKEGKIISGIAGTLDDRVLSIDLNPEYYGGVQNTFSYGSIEMDFLFQFAKQMGQYNPFGRSRPGTFYGANNIGNQPVEVLERWKEPGDIANVQKVRTTWPREMSTSYTNASNSDAAFMDASFIRLKNLSISWTLPNSWQQKVSMNGARFFLQGQNILTITKYKGLDPETRTSSLAVPALRVITVGFRTSF
ncbi:TonB-dependent receptor [Chitinophaga japonensis]